MVMKKNELDQRKSFVLSLAENNAHDILLKKIERKYIKTTGVYLTLKVSAYS